MSKIQELAERSVNNLKGLDGGREAALDPAVLSGLFEIIMQLIIKLQECKKTPAEGVKVANSPSFLQRAAAGLEVRKYLGDRKAFRKHGEALKAAILKTGAEVSVEDLTEAYDEV